MRVVVVCAIALCALPCLAKEGDKIPAVRAETPPVIDGVLDDAVWETAPTVTGFTNTRDNQPEPNATIVRIVYDDQFLYVAAEMMQDRDTIQATIRKYDRFELRFEDYFQVMVDTFHDHQQAYIFLVSPLGTRWDSRDGVYDRNVSWDAEWPAATKILDDRWVVEMAIPIGEMTFEGGEDTTWGIQFRRQDRVGRANSHWSYDPNAGIDRRASGPKTVADFGELVGLDLSNVTINQRPLLEQYVSVTSTRRKGGDLHTRLATGLDLELRLSRNWFATVTVNPDFGQVEADSDNIDLRDTERFVPERRTFFNEGAELFQTPIQLYNSRRITDIDYAAKVTGTGADWTMGVLELEGEGVRSGDANFVVARYTMKPTDKLQLGTVWISADREDGYNYTFGVDKRLTLTPSISWTSQLVFMEDRRDIIVTDDRGLEYDVTERLSEYAFETELNGGSVPWRWQFGYRDISDDFDPDLAFILRKDVVGPYGFVSYRKEVNKGLVDTVSALFMGQYYRNHDNDTVLRDFDFQAGVDLSNNFDIELFRNEDFRKPYDNRETGIEIDYNTQDRLHSIRTSWSYGVFQDAPFEQFSITKPFGIGDRFTSELEVNFRREDRSVVGDTDVWLVRWVNEYTWTWEGRVRLTLEESSEDRYNRTLLFAYEDVGQWDFYFLLNDVESGGEVVRGFFTKFVYRF